MPEDSISLTGVNETADKLEAYRRRAGCARNRAAVGSRNGAYTAASLRLASAMASPRLCKCGVDLSDSTVES